MEATQEVHDLVALIVGRLGRTETLKLQKLLYYCQAWSLATQDKPFFADEIQAWKNGPVVVSVYQLHHGEPSLEQWPAGDASRLPATDQALANAVIDLYGARSGWALRRLTQAEPPWQDAWERNPEGRPVGEAISQAAIIKHFQPQIERALDSAT